MSSKTLRTLQAQKAVHTDRMQAIITAAEGSNRDLTDAESREFSAERAASNRLTVEIDAELAKLNGERGAPVSRAGARTNGTVHSGDPTFGFNSFGEFAMSVRESALPGVARDERLGISASAPSTFGGEGSGQDGGYLVPPQFSQEVFSLMLDDDSILNLTDDVDIAGNSMSFPKDETTPWGTDGVRAYWQAEAQAGTQTKPKLGLSTLRLHRLMALVPVSDDLLDDATALGSYLPRLMARSINFKLGEALFNGTGAGQPLGAFKGGAAVVQNKDSGQAANTISLLNCANMIARLPPGSYKTARWYITPDALPSLFTLTLGNYPVYLPVSSGAQSNPYGMLLGRPIEVSQHVGAFSTQGDLSLVDWSFYRTITKASGVQTDTSMHLYFDAAATAFRCQFRIDGQPKIAAAITQAKGSNTLSPFVQLQAR